jgi:predicted RNA-binding protein YlxR (DUF448 family)
MGMSKGHIPIRTCISCGTKRTKNELVRLVLDAEDQLVRDVCGKRQGRGAYVCNATACMEKLSKDKRLNRIFRTHERIRVSPAISNNDGAP